LTLTLTLPNDNTNATEHTVGNTVRKLLHHIREEYNNASKGEATISSNEFSIANFVLQGQPQRQVAAQKAESTLVLREDDADDPDSFARTLKPVVMEAIQEILDDLDTVYDNIAKSAKDHIHSECASPPPPPLPKLKCFIPYILTGNPQ
jgi:translation initiation factor eIF-2B subunit beta